MSKRFATVLATTLTFVGAAVLAITQPNLTVLDVFQPPTVAAQPQAQADPESLDGTWELVSVIEDGKVVPLDIIKQTMIKDARVIIKGAVVAVTRPNDRVQTLAFVTNSKGNPKTIDIAGAHSIGSRGIYMRDGDTLMICTRGSEGESRPAMMASLPNSDTFLMTFRRVEGPPAAELPPPPPPPARPTNENNIQKMLIGTWGHQTDEEIVKVTLNADGTFSISTTYKKGIKKVFTRDDRASGKWRLNNGTVTMTQSASTQRGKVGQVYSYRITSISDSEILYVDNVTGQRRIVWKLR